MNFYKTLMITLLACGCAYQAPENSSAHDRPNILLIVADDLGYSEIGPYGGEIDTPNLDMLAARGVSFNQFYVAPTCSPTRAMLMSGTDNHIAGLGNMHEVLMGMIPIPVSYRALTEAQKGMPGYEGHLNFRVSTLPDLMREAGYATVMAGKWHLGADVEYRPGNRGFDRSFALLDGGGSHFSDGWALPAPKRPAKYTEDDELIELPEDFYSTTHFTDKLIGYLSENFEEGSGKPFFGYLAFTAPHDPLQLPDADIDLYNGKYYEGYDVWRTRRFQRLSELGVTDASNAILPPLEFVPPWESLTDEEKAQHARWMEVYAGMVTVMDREIGRVIDFLEEHNELENTLILFLSDNGAAAGTYRTYGFSAEEFNNSLENAGRRDSYTSYGPAWAQVGSTPFRLFKGALAEGGIRAPLIVAGPGVAEGRRSGATTHVVDILPTLLDASNADFSGPDDLSPIIGKSLVPVLVGDTEHVRDENEAVAWELFGNRAILKGDWKATMIVPPTGTGEWALFDIEQDTFEQQDLSKDHPEKLSELIAEWNAYAVQNGIITVPSAPD